MVGGLETDFSLRRIFKSSNREKQSVAQPIQRREAAR
jgi:hypothetical protein